MIVKALIESIEQAIIDAKITIDSEVYFNSNKDYTELHCINKITANPVGYFILTK